MLGWRDWQRRTETRAIEAGRGLRNVLIVGSGKLGRRVAAFLERGHVDGRVVVGFLDENEPIAGEVRGRVEDLAQVARAEFVDEIILTTPHQPELVRRVIQEARRNPLDVRGVLPCFWFEPEALALDNFGHFALLKLPQEPVPKVSLFFKRPG